MRLHRKTAFFAFVSIALAMARAPTAYAGGDRYPIAERLVENPADPNKLYVSSTFGLMITQDRGHSWYHVCSAAFAFDPGYTGNPWLRVTGNGSLLVDVQSGMISSRDEGCD